MAGDMARTSSGVWKGIADAVDPSGRKPRETPAPTPEPAAPTLGPDDDAGTMVVPLDTWTRILDQLGNLHDAGQQLADARERAAKAETENEFLREQVRELKQKAPRRRPPAAPRNDPPALLSEPVTEPVALTPERRRIRARRAMSRWLEPRNPDPR